MNKEYKISTDSQEFLEIEIKRRPTYALLVLTGLWTVGAAAMILTISYGLISSSHKLDFLLSLVLFLLMVLGAFTLKTFLWHLQGKENVIVGDKNLKIIKLGTILSVSRDYELELVEGIASTSNSPFPWWMKLYGMAGGQIRIEYLGDDKYFGQTIPLDQAEEVAQLIRDRIKKQPQLRLNDNHSGQSAAPNHNGWFT